VERVRRLVTYQRDRDGNITAVRLRIPRKFMERLGYPQVVYLELDEVNKCILIRPAEQIRSSQ